MKWLWVAIGPLLFAGAIVSCGDDDGSSSGVGGGGGSGLLTTEAGSLNGLAVVNPACGTGDGGPVDDCVTCTAQQCAARLDACFGTTWNTTLVGGVCQSFGQCVADCSCGSNDCFKACVAAVESSSNDPCLDCLYALFACEEAMCAAECLEPEEDAGAEDGSVEDGSDGDAGGGRPDGSGKRD